MTVSSHPFSKRRTALFAGTHTTSIFTAHDAVQMNADQPYPYQQESSFLYLTGIKEPGWILVVDDQSGTLREFLIAPTISQSKQLFDGSLAWTEVSAISGITTIYDKETGWNEVAELAKRTTQVVTIGAHPHEKYFDFSMNPAVARLRRKLHHHFDSIDDCRQAIAKARAIKSEDEIEAIRKAIRISVAGFNAVKETLAKKGAFTHEYDVEAVLNAAFRKEGAEGHAYTPIVAVGKNACTLHYIDNSSELPKNGLLLIDAGSKVNGYAADITRTYAIGTPSEREKAVHAAVAKAHQEIISLLKPELKVSEYHEKVDEIMKLALTELGLPSSDDAYRTYFPHAISHGLGLDVHDSLGAPVAFLPGMVLTVEPGIYIPEEGIGVRIEDDILITENGNENLSGGLSIAL